MKFNDYSIVITTVQPPTPSVSAFAARLSNLGGLLYIVGDRKGPSAYPLPGTRFYSLERQLASSFVLAKLLPVNHYSRKNIGYLAAIVGGATCIYDTDDDNAPLPGWCLREEKVHARRSTRQGWVNVYRGFSAETVWPRGFPLDEIGSSQASPLPLEPGERLVSAPIQQGLANNSPDVDAIWRLVMDRPLDFADGPSICLPPGSWCPFNSQSTWWWPVAYPLLYLPSTCSFRMTDIWRSFIAQRCPWELGSGVVFHGAEVVQDRNPHRLMKDFEDEIPGYRQNKAIAALLSSITLQPGLGRVGANLMLCYEELCGCGIVDRSEIPLVEAWLADLEKSRACE